MVNAAADSFIKPGICLAEAVSGTNAIPFAERFRKSVYTLPLHHYCSFLKEWHLFSIPLIINDKFEGCLTFASISEPIKNEKLLITELLSYIIVLELKDTKNNPICLERKPVRLTKKQLEILRLIAAGNTDINTAIDIGVSLGTVRYHKNNIFKKLNVESSTQAVVKALKLKLISLDDIHIDI